jgi:hypothetical protein
VLKKSAPRSGILAAKCEGDALINYGSGAQLLKILTGMKGLKSIEDTEDETLEKYSHIPVMAALRKYRTLSKEIGTYGNQWVTQWTTKPCKEEGWLHPGDGRLHCVFNQYDAERDEALQRNPTDRIFRRTKKSARVSSLIRLTKTFASHFVAKRTHSRIRPSRTSALLLKLATKPAIRKQKSTSSSPLTCPALSFALSRSWPMIRSGSKHSVAARMSTP